MERMNMRVVENTKEVTVMEMPVAGNTQPLGLLHGGASAALAEAVASVAAVNHVPPGCVSVGTELSISHIASVKEGMVRASARLVGATRSQGVFLISFEDDRGRHFATARMTARFVAPRKP